MTKLSAYIRTYDVASKMSPRFFLASSTIQESKSRRPCFLQDLAGWQYSFSRRKTPFYLLTNRFNTATIAALVSSSMFLSRSSNDDEFTLARTPNPPPPPPPPLLQKPFPVPKHRNGRFHRPRYIGYERSSLVQSRFNSASNLLGTIESARILISREFV